jgi:hypothetical protein
MQPPPPCLTQSGLGEDVMLQQSVLLCLQLQQGVNYHVSLLSHLETAVSRVDNSIAYDINSFRVMADAIEACCNDITSQFVRCQNIDQRSERSSTSQNAWPKKYEIDPV